MMDQGLSEKSYQNSLCIPLPMVAQRGHVSARQDGGCLQTPKRPQNKTHLPAPSSGTASFQTRRSQCVSSEALVWHLCLS